MKYYVFRCQTCCADCYFPESRNYHGSRLTCWYCHRLYILECDSSLLAKHQEVPKPDLALELLQTFAETFVTEFAKRAAEELAKEVVKEVVLAVLGKPRKQRRIA